MSKEISWYSTTNNIAMFLYKINKVLLYRIKGIQGIHGYLSLMYMGYFYNTFIIISTTYRIMEAFFFLSGF